MRPDAASAIADALAAVERDEECRILLAVESGSRAWGFPSPDSDWDVRFIYVHRPRWYIALRPGRDVIERMLPGALDLAGWNLRKALNLLLNGNATLREWLASPLVYRRDKDAAAALAALVAALPARAQAQHHYAALASRQIERAEAGGEVRLKGYLYALRPALVLAWMAQHDCGTPPMDMPALLAATQLDSATRAAVDDLVERKMAGVELGQGPRVPVLDAFIAAALALPRDDPAPPGHGVMAEAEDLFRRLVGIEAVS